MKKGCILIMITLCFFGCGNDETELTASTVHLAGYLSNSNMDGDYVASYWKDSVYTNLTGEGIRSRVTSMCVDGSSVLIGGWKHFADETRQVVVWHDDTETVIDEAFGDPMIASRNNNLFGVWLSTTGWVFNKNGISQPISDTAYSFAPMAMTILGDDIYMSGFSESQPLPANNYSPPPYAQYWKNGQLIFRESEVSNAVSIFTYQNDVYMAGVLYPSGGPTSIACYWKNGQRVDLTDGSGVGVATASSIFVTDTHVYTAGMIDNQAVYWKDDEAIFLPTEAAFSMANSIFVQGTNVHVAGHQDRHPVYWKNDEQQYIANQDKPGQVLFVAVGSN